MILLSVFLLLICGVYAESGTELYASGDYSGAITAFEQNLSGISGPKQAPVLNNIATCYVALGEPDTAITYYTQAVDADPSYGRGWINLGVMQEKLGNTEDAISSYEKVDLTDPALYAEAKVKKGSLLAALGDYSEALSSFNLARSGATGTVVVDLYTGIGAVEFLQKNTDAAEDAFLKAINASPDGAALAYTNLGVLRISQGRNDEARELLERAILNDPLKQTQAEEYLKKLDNLSGKES